MTREEQWEITKEIELITRSWKDKKVTTCDKKEKHDRTNN